jgi:hypothetical protein
LLRIGEKFFHPLSGTFLPSPRNPSNTVSYS